jgi:hypothetical protein
MNIGSFDILMQLLRDRPAFFMEIEQQKNLDKKIISLLFCSSLFLALYGAIIGSTNGILQMVSSAFKLPAFREIESNFYIEVVKIIGAFLGLN